MVPALFFSQLGLIALVWLCLLRYWAWPSDGTTVHPTPLRRTRSREPTPFAVLLQKLWVIWYKGAYCLSLSVPETSYEPSLPV
jgi:hypothetical protein